MAVGNKLATRSNQRMGMAAYLTNDAVKNQINQIVGGKSGPRFISSIISAVQTNPALAECTNQSILSAALLGESLKLSPSPQLGQFYMVPYKDRERGTVAQFQLGYKGYIQLAVRSGQYKKLNVIPIKEGELISYNPLDEEIEVELIQDEEQREKAETIGYYAMFEYTNGFRKTLYWSKKKMQAHAKKYSPGYASDLRKGTAYTFWSKDFDGMAMKTMLRQLISKWGIMSIEMQTALETDMAVIKPDLTPDYVETEEVPVAISQQSAEEAVQKAQEEPVKEETEEIMPKPESRQEKAQAKPAGQKKAAQQDDIAAALFGNQ